VRQGSFAVGIVFSDWQLGFRLDLPCPDRTLRSPGFPQIRVDFPSTGKPAQDLVRHAREGGHPDRYSNLQLRNHTEKEYWMMPGNDFLDFRFRGKDGSH